MPASSASRPAPDADPAPNGAESPVAGGIEEDVRNETSWDLSGVLGWDNDTLVVTDSEVAASLVPQHLSPSTMKAMDSCVARWLAERLLRNDEVDPFGKAELGTSAHSVLEDFYQLPPEHRTEEAAMGVLLAHSKVKWPGKDALTYAKRGLWVSAVHSAYEGLFEIEDPTGIEVYANEMRLEGEPLGDAPFKGFVDRIDITPDGLRVVDYKSGKVPDNIGRFGDDHGDQIRLYREVLRNKLGEAPASGLLLYTRHAKARNVPFGQSYINKVLKKWNLAWAQLNKHTAASVYPTKTSALCGWCPLVNACPVGQAEGKEDRTGGMMPAAVDLGIPVLREFDATVVATGSGGPSPVDDFAADMAKHEAREHARRIAAALDGFDEPAPVPVPSVLTGAVEPAPDLDPDVVEAVELEQEISHPPLEPGSEPEAAAYSPSDSNSTHQTTPASAQVASELEEPVMNPAELSVDRPYYHYSDGLLNADSYAVIAVSGLASMAYDQLVAAALPVNKQPLDALAGTFAFIVNSVQVAILGKVDYQQNFHTRLRGFLHAYINANPLPWGATEEGWAAWTHTGVRHVYSLAQAALRLHEVEHNASATPWSLLATAPVTAEQQTA